MLGLTWENRGGVQIKRESEINRSKNKVRPGWVKGKMWARGKSCFTYMFGTLEC